MRKRNRPILASAFAVFLATSSALATVTEPNGLQVPQPAPSNETSLNVFFASRGEAVDWQADAHPTPNSFSPLCGFTATFVLNQAGSHFGLAWYNETGQKPAANQLHVLVPANSPVGTMFTGTSIKNDPAYAGGLIGFALVGGETHYTNASYDNVCTGCNPAAPWVTALMYASKNTPNAYYICFEDGATTASGWNNDGDFNDDVFFLTGITCAGGAQPCDTGKPGVCGPGLTQCSATGTTCQQLTQPAPMETCNGLDDDCNGQVDEGDICPAGQVCDHGTCVAKCGTGEFICPGNLVCNAAGYCVDPQCSTVTCPAGQVCVAGACKAPCDDIVCPFPTVCRVGKCVDPCAGVTCASGEVCDQGVCVPTCDCAPCPTSTACDTTSGSCVDPLCVGTICPGMQHCQAGNCVDNCMGAKCPAGEICQMGACVTDPNAGGSSGSSGSSGVFVGAGPGGTTATGMSGTSGSGKSSGAGADTGGAGGAGGGAPGSSGSCGCRVGERDGVSEGLVGAGLLALAAAWRRRRRG
jgi:MYXO-CTERM domain-containing protein